MAQQAVRVSPDRNDPHDVVAKGVDKPLLTVIAGMDKAFRSTLAARDYAQVKSLGEEYRARNPRSVA